VTIKFYNRILLYNILTATKCRYVIDIVNHVIIITSGQTISQASTTDSTRFQSNIMNATNREHCFQVSFIFQFVQFLLRLSSAQHPQISHLYSSNTFSNKCQFWTNLSPRYTIISKIWFKNQKKKKMWINADDCLVVVVVYINSDSENFLLI
jgi:hypothetical protein